jgi:hypothetical protein
MPTGGPTLSLAQRPKLMTHAPAGQLYLMGRRFPRWRQAMCHFIATAFPCIGISVGLSASVSGPTQAIRWLASRPYSAHFSPTHAIKDTSPSSQNIRHALPTNLASGANIATFGRWHCWGDVLVRRGGGHWGGVGATNECGIGNHPRLVQNR